MATVKSFRKQPLGSALGRRKFLQSLAYPCLARAATISEANRDSDGFVSYSVESEFQESLTEIKVLTPSLIPTGKRLRLLYVLPVETGNGKTFGHGLIEARRLDLHNRYDLICVYPTFAQSSWFADNPLDPKIRQESYFLKVVVPFVEERYPAIRERRGRLLVGFSKSGWGAFSLLLRHSELFEKAAAWDAPISQTDPTNWRYFKQKFGTVENFQNYRIDLLLQKKAPELRREKRLILMGHGGQRDLYMPTHDLKVRLNIQHDFVDGPLREHRWDSGWLADAVKLLSE